MTENTTNEPKETHNGVVNGKSQETSTTTESTHKEPASPSKKKKKKKHAQRSNNQGSLAQPVSTTADTEAILPLPDEASNVQPDEPPVDQPNEPPNTPPAEESSIDATAGTEEIADVPAENLRLRVKVWTDPSTSKRYLVPQASWRDTHKGQPISDVLYAYAIRDDDIKYVTLRMGEWNALPFFYFQEDGPAPRVTERPSGEVVTQ